MYTVRALTLGYEAANIGLSALPMLFGAGWPMTIIWNLLWGWLGIPNCPRTMEHMKTAPKSSKSNGGSVQVFFVLVGTVSAGYSRAILAPFQANYQLQVVVNPPSVTLVYKHQRLTQATEWGSILYHGAPGTFSAQCVRSWNLRPLDGNDGCEVLACNQFWD